VRAVRELGALGVQLEADAVNLPLHEDRYDPLFDAMESSARVFGFTPTERPGRPVRLGESASFLLWQVFGWTFDTTMTVSELSFAGIYDRHPQLKLIAHQPDRRAALEGAARRSGAQRGHA
jgi:predicted TIM-barrel fold metal-dependent hydrolase